MYVFDLETGRFKKRLVLGVGINDADYPVRRNKTMCPFYAKWVGMLRRSYCGKYKKSQPTYKDCTVCDEWLTFSNFRSWMEKQDWQGKHLDKDILHPGNKVYSPDTCCFVDKVTNNFVEDRAALRGDEPLGVHFNKSYRKYQAYCRNPFTKKRDHLGLFNCPGLAHKAFLAHKHKLACALAKIQSDPRVSEALTKRYKME